MDTEEKDQEQGYGAGNAPPTDGEIAAVKAKHPGREVVLVELVAEDVDVFSFIMTRPTKVEFTKYRLDVTKAGHDLEKIENAIENGALAQIRWPSRETCREIFAANPGLVQNFGEELSKLARAEVEVRSKKL